MPSESKTVNLVIDIIQNKYLSRKEREEKISQLIANGVDINSSGSKNKTPLEVALGLDINGSQKEMVSFLLEKGANKPIVISLKEAKLLYPKLTEKEREEQIRSDLPESRLVLTQKKIQEEKFVLALRNIYNEDLFVHQAKVKLTSTPSQYIESDLNFLFTRAIILKQYKAAEKIISSTVMVSQLLMNTMEESLLQAIEDSSESEALDHCKEMVAIMRKGDLSHEQEFSQSQLQPVLNKALIKAAQKNSEGVIRFLLAEKADLNYQDEQTGNTIFHELINSYYSLKDFQTHLNQDEYTVEGNMNDIQNLCRDLSEMKPNLTLEDNNGKSILDIISERGAIEWLSLFTKVSDEEKLIWALENNCVGLIQPLMQKIKEASNKNYQEHTDTDTDTDTDTVTDLGTDTETVTETDTDTVTDTFTDTLDKVIQVAIDSKKTDLLELLLDEINEDLVHTNALDKLKSALNTNNRALAQSLYQALFKVDVTLSIKLEKGINEVGELLLKDIRHNNKVRPPLFKAILDNNPNKVQELINQGADLNEIYNDSSAVLTTVCCNKEDCDVLNVLIKNKANINGVNGEVKVSPLTEAAICGHVNPALVLIKAGATLDQINGDRGTAYEAALASKEGETFTENKKTIARLLYKEMRLLGHEITTTNFKYSGDSLNKDEHKKIEKENPQDIGLIEILKDERLSDDVKRSQMENLLNRGAKIDAKGKEAKTCLDLALSLKANLSIIKLLVDHEATLPLTLDEISLDTVRTLYKENDVELMAKLVIENKVDLLEELFKVHLENPPSYDSLYSTKQIQSRTITDLETHLTENLGELLEIAIANNHTEIVKLLFRTASDYHFFETNKITDNSFITENESTHALYELLKERCSDDEIKAIGASATNYINERHKGKHSTELSSEICSQINDGLINVNDIDVHAKDKDGNTALHWAVKNKDNKDLMAELINKGAIVGARNNKNFTPLHSAAENGCLAGIEALLENGANINVQDNSDSTPLIYAIETGDLTVIESLLKEGANTKIKDANNNHPLHHAVKIGKEKGVRIVDLVLKYSKELNCKNNSGQNPYQLAVHLNQENAARAIAVEMLKSGINPTYEGHGSELHEKIIRTIEVPKTNIARKFSENYQQSDEELVDMFESNEVDVNTLVLAIKYRQIKAISEYFSSQTDFSNHIDIIQAAIETNDKDIMRLVFDKLLNRNSDCFDDLINLIIENENTVALNIMMSTLKERKIDAYLEKMIENKWSVGANELIDSRDFVDDKSLYEYARMTCNYEFPGLLKAITNKFSNNPFDVNHRFEEENDSTLLHIAASKGHKSTVKFLLNTFGADANLMDSDKKTAIEYAANCGKDDLLRELYLKMDKPVLDKGNEAIKKLKQIMGDEIHARIESGYVNLQTYNELKESGYDLNEKGSNGFTPARHLFKNYIEHKKPIPVDLSLYFFNQLNEEDKKTELFNCFSDVLLNQSNDYSCMHEFSEIFKAPLILPGVLASKLNTLEGLFAELVNNGFDINSKLENGKTMLMMALENNNTQLVTLILDFYKRKNLTDKIDLTVADSSGYHLIHHAVCANNIDAVERLVIDFNDKVDRSTTRSNTQTAPSRGLHLAIKNKLFDMVNKLLSFGSYTGGYQDELSPFYVSNQLLGNDKTKMNELLCLYTTSHVASLDSTALNKVNSFIKQCIRAYLKGCTDYSTLNQFMDDSLTNRPCDLVQEKAFNLVKSNLDNYFSNSSYRNHYLFKVHRETGFIISDLFSVARARPNTKTKTNISSEELINKEMYHNPSNFNNDPNSKALLSNYIRSLVLNKDGEVKNGFGGFCRYTHANGKRIMGISSLVQITLRVLDRSQNYAVPYSELVCQLQKYARSEILITAKEKQLKKIILSLDPSQPLDESQAAQLINSVETVACTGTTPTAYPLVQASPSSSVSTDNETTSSNGWNAGFWRTAGRKFMNELLGNYNSSSENSDEIHAQTRLNVSAEPVSQGTNLQ